MLTTDKLLQLKNSIHPFRVDGIMYVFATYANRLFQLNEEEAVVVGDILNSTSNLDVIISSLSSAQSDFLLGLYGFCATETGIPDTPKLNSLVLLISEACNFACTYCYGSYGEKSRKMSIETAIHAIDVALELGIRDVVFFGGEPLTNFPVIRKAVDHIEQSAYDSVQLRMTTNASLVTEEIARYLQKHNFQVSVSMDGDYISHNTTRVYRDGSPTYSEVVSGIDLLKQYGVLTLLEVTYSRRHSDLKKQLESALELFPVVSCACVDGKKGCRHSEDIVSGKQLQDYYTTLLDIEKDIHEDKTIIGAHELYNRICDGSSLASPRCLCSDIGTRLIVTPDGRIVPCPEMTEESEYTICNIDKISSIYELIEKREKVLDKLSSERLEKKWFTPLCETCIQHVDLVDGKFVYQDEDSFCSCIESLLKRFLSEQHE